MSKTLMGAVIKAGQIEATHQIVVLGETSVKTKNKDFSEATKALAKSLVDLCDDLTPEIDDVIGVQLYTAITDPIAGGICVDLLFGDNSSHRVNNPPADIATLRDEVKAAISAEL